MKKLRKIIFNFILIALFLIIFSTSSNAAATVGKRFSLKMTGSDGVEYSIAYVITSLDPAEVMLDDCENDFVGDFVVPSQVTYENTNYTVTGLGDYNGFWLCSDITTITIPETIRYIEDESKIPFQSGSLTAINVNSNNQYFTSTNGVLYNKDKTELIRYPENKTDLTSYTIPSSVSLIKAGAFYDCDALNTITIPNTVTEIEEKAFYSCGGATTINLNAQITVINTSVFSGCSSLKTITIPSTVTEIGKSAFSSCSALTSLTIPTSVTTIGDSAFSSCSALTGITIPASVTTIGSSVFNSCTSLTAINVNTSNSNYSSTNGILFNKDKTTLIRYPQGKVDVTTYTIPSTVVEIAESGFYYCNTLAKITIPNTVTTLGTRAFYYCEGLTSMNVPESITTLPTYVFGYCKNMTSVILPDTLTNIGGDAFYYCTNLATIDIPEKITKINSYAFYCCEKLDNITIKSNIKEIGSDAFSNCKALKNLNLENGIEKIGDGAFYNCTTLASLTIPESVISIGEDAFYNNTSLTTIVVPKTVTTIGETAFPVTTEMYVRDESAALEYAVANTNPYTIIPELEWKVISSSLDKTKEEVSIVIQGGNENFSGTLLEKDDINIFLKNSSNMFVDSENIKDISYDLSDPTSISNGVEYVITLGDFEDYEGEIGIQIESGTLVDTYGYTNDKTDILEVTDNVADFVSPTITYQDLQINQSEKTLYLEFDLEDNYYSHSDIEENDITLYVDCNINANNMISDYKTIDKISDISGEVNGISKKVGERYSLLITNLDEITDTGMLTIVINEDVAYDSSGNSNMISEIAFADIVIDFVKPNIEVLNGVVNQDMQSVSLRIVATENYNISGKNLDTNNILVYTLDEEGNYEVNTRVSKVISSKEEIKDINNEDNVNYIEFILELSNFGKYSGSIAIEFLEGAIEDTLGNKNEFTRQVEIKGSTDWRIFYNDGDNIFIIAEDVLPTSMITTENIETQDSYKAYWTDVYTDSVDESDIDFEKFMFSNTFLETNQNYIQISTLLKTGNWENLTNQIYADSAIGSPTLEMFLSSWNEKYPDNRVYYHKMNENGYYIGTVEDYEICENTNALDALSNTAGTNLNFSQFEGATDELYFGTDTDTQGYWIASPSPWVFDMCIYYSLNTGNWSCSSGNGSNRGIRPVVCIKENTLGTKIGDTWSINTTNGENLAETISAENYGDYIDYPVVLKDDILTVDFVEFADLKYSYDDTNKTAIVVGITEGIELVGEYAIPSEVVNPEDGEYYTITEIGMNSFSGVSQMTKIRLPDTITNIEVGAFADCTALKEIDTSKNLVRISAFALSGSGLEEIYIPKSVSDITSLTFEACDKLKSIVVEEENPYYTDNDGVLFNKDETLLIRFPSNKELESYTVPDSVKTLNCEAFYNCFNLREITIPANVNQIEYGCFLGCNNLNKINFSEGLKEIGNHAFMTCNSLEEIILPESLTSLESCAFSNCINLKSIKISLNDANLQEKLAIGDTVFEYCSEELIIETRLNSSAHIYAVDNGIDYEIMDVASTEIDGATYGYLTFEEAFEASEENGTITLLEDLEITEETVLDLENKTISGNIKNTSNLTLKNGTINGTITNDGTLTTENIEIVSDTYALTTSAANTMDAEDIVFNINLGTVLKGKEKAINNNISLLECTVNIPEGYALMTEIDGEYEVSNLEEKCTSLKIFVNNTVEEWKKGDINKDGLVTNFDALLFGRILAGWTSVEKEYFDLDDDGVISESEEENFVYICDIDENNKVSNPDLTDMMRNVLNLNGDYEPNKFYKDESITFSGYTEPENQEVTWKVEDIDEEGNSLGTSNRATINSTTGKFTAIDTGLVKITVTSKTDSEVTDVLVLDIVEKCTEIRILVDGTAEEWKKGDINKDGCISNFDTDILSKLLIGVEEIKIFYFDIDGDGVISESEEENYLYICDVNEDGKISITDSVTIKQGIVGFENVEVRNILYKDDTLTFKPYTEPENQEAIWSVTDIELDEENNVIDLETNNKATIDSATGELTALESGLIQVTVTSKTTLDKKDTLILEIKERTSEISIYVDKKVDNSKIGDLNKDGYITDWDLEIIYNYLMVESTEGIEEYIDYDGDGSASEEEVNEFMMLADYNKDNNIDILDCTLIFNIVNSANMQKDINIVYKDDTVAFLSNTLPENDVVIWSVEDIDEEGNSLGTNTRATINSSTGEFTALDTGLVKITALPETNTELTSSVILNIKERTSKIDTYVNQKVNNPEVGDLNRDGFFTEVDSLILLNVIDGHDVTEYKDVDGDGIISESEEGEFFRLCDVNCDGEIKIFDSIKLLQKIHQVKTTGENAKFYKNESITFSAITTPEGDDVIWSVQDMDEEGNSLGTSARATINSSTGEFTALETGFVKVTATPKSNSSLSSYFILEVSEYTITYDLDGGSLETGVTNPETYNVNDSFTLNNPTKVGHTFIGWTTDEITEPVMNLIVEVGTKGNKTYKANYSINSYNLTISYIFENGEKASEPFVISGVYGESFDIDSPEVVGYIPDIECVEVILEEDTNITVTYNPSMNTKYTVEHYLQNLENDDYTLYRTYESAGTTNEYTLAVPETIEGFTGLEVGQERINADGSTVIKIYYTRNYYTVTIKYLYEDGSEALRDKVERLKYGSYFAVAYQDIAGYTPDEMIYERGIVEDITFEFVYSPNTDTEYIVQHYKQNLENDEYTLVETETKTGTTDTNTEATSKGYEGFTVQEILQQNINGNGRSIVEVYYDRNYYKLIYKVDGVQDGEVETYKYEAPIIPRENPSKTGYKFSGWNSVPETMPASHVEVTGTFAVDDGQTKELSYTVEYYKNGTKVDADTQIVKQTVQTLEPDILTVDKSKINVTDKYLGYLCSGTEPNQIPDTISTGSTIKVNYTAIPYEIRYMLDGGTVQVANPEVYTINDSFTLNNPEKVGHTFIGWTGNGITEPTINLTVEAGTIGNLVFDAHYSVNQYELQINYSGIPTEKDFGELNFVKKYNYGETFSVTSPEIPGYTPSIAVVEGVMEARTMSYEVIYTPNTDTEYIVHHFKQNIENDSYTMVETEILKGTTDTLTNVIPKQFEGFHNMDIEQKNISGDPFARTVIDVLYDRNRYDLTYKVDGVQDGEVETYKFEAPITPRENLSKLGYKFSGWNSVPETMPANDVEVSGTFSIDDEQRKDINYKVEYYKDGELIDTDVFTQNVQVLTNTLTVDKSQINVADKYLGYSFERTEPESIPETVNSGDVIKVYYMVNNYTVSYDLDGGSFEDVHLQNMDIYTVNDLFKLKNPTKEGYTFIGWTENDGDTPEIDKEIPVGSTGNKTFKAHYAINSYNLEISYVYEDGREIAPKHTEAIEYNSDYSVNTPVIPGYTADISVVSGTMEAENKSVVVTYRPNADTPYKVEHYKQNVENNEYTLIDTENMSGTTDTDTMAIAREYEGFTVGEIVNVKISGNGDSIAKVYYTRNSYNYQVRYFYDNVENEENRTVITARYESVISTYEDKVIPGYGLDKTENLPLTIKLSEEENIINVYYVRQQYEYTVHYFFDGVERVEAKETGNALFGNVIEEYQDKAEYGYKFEGTENYPLKVTEISENNSINVYYIRKDSNVIVEYRDLVTNEEISEKVIKQAKVFDSFDVSENVKEIEGYTLIERPEVLTGEYSEEEQTKVYKYAKNSQVKVNYLEKDTNAILAESTIINGYETKDYETKAKQIENYTFVECENPKGKMGREEIVVNYYYAQNTKVTVNYIDMYTNEILETVVQDGIVGDEYSSKSKEIDNYVLVEKPEQEEVTMQKEEIVLNYYYVMISKGVIEKHIDLVTNEIIHTAVHEGNENDPYKIEPLSQEEYILVEDKLPTNAEGLMEKNAIIVTYFYMRKASVKVIYVDELTQEVLSEEIIEGYESKAYKAQEKAFEGYSLTVRPDKSEGAMKVTKDEEGNVHTETILTYKYRKVSGGVVEKHYDIKTNEVLVEKVYSGLENDSYKIEPKVFEGYDIYEEKMPENAEGLMKQDVIEVNYYYIRKATVKIEYINVNTNEKIVDDIILNRHEGDEYKSERKKFASYVVLEERLPEKESGIIEITKDEEGNLITEINIKYYYARKTSIRVEYIDKKSSEKISKDYVLEGYEGQDYKVEAKEIEGYKLLDEQENAEGKMTKDELVVKFYYEKIKVEEPEDNKQEEQPEKDPSEESPVEPPKEENPGEKPGDTEGDKEESQTITSNIYAVKENRISKIISGTSIAELKKNIVADGNIMILSKDGKEVKDDEIVKTGMKLKLENNEEYSLIVRGDISCDGKISLTDLSKLILHYNEKKGFILSDSPYYAADLNHDDKVSIIDVSQMLILYNSI